MVTEIRALQPEPVTEPPAARVPERAVHPAVPARHEQVDVVAEPGQTGHRAAGRDGEMVTEIRVLEPEPVTEPPAARVPERAVHPAVPAGGEQVDGVLEPGQRRHRRPRRGGEMITEIRVLEPEPVTEPPAAGIPERAVHPAVPAGSEQ